MASDTERLHNLIMIILNMSGAIQEYHQLEVCSRNEEQRVNRAKKVLDHIDKIRELSKSEPMINDESGYDAIESFEHYIKSIANIADSEYI